MKVSAIITLANPLSRAGSDRWGAFMRPRGERNHWWQGRKLSVEEFNTEFPKAVRFAGPDRPLVGQIFIEDGETVSVATNTTPTIPLAEHEAKIADIQAGVNEWQGQQNANLEAAKARIDELERLLAEKPAPAEETVEAAPPVETPISEVPADTSAAPEGSEPGSAGAQSPVNPPPGSKSAPKKKAKK